LALPDLRIATPAKDGADDYGGGDHGDHDFRSVLQVAA
jgi:hypothetical protein